MAELRLRPGLNVWWTFAAGLYRVCAWCWALVIPAALLVLLLPEAWTPAAAYPAVLCMAALGVIGWPLHFLLRAARHPSLP